MATSTLKGSLRNLERGENSITLVFDIKAYPTKTLITVTMSEPGTVKRTGKETYAAESYWAHWEFDADDGTRSDHLRFVVNRLAQIYRHANAGS